MGISASWSRAIDTPLPPCSNTPVASKKTHDCEWRERAAELETKIAERDEQFASLLKRVNEIEHSMSVTKRAPQRRTADRTTTAEANATAPLPPTTAKDESLLAPSERARIALEPARVPRPKRATKPRP